MPRLLRVLFAHQLSQQQAGQALRAHPVVAEPCLFLSALIVNNDTVVAGVILARMHRTINVDYNALHRTRSDHLFPLRLQPELDKAADGFGTS